MDAVTRHRYQTAIVLVTAAALIAWLFAALHFAGVTGVISPGMADYRRGIAARALAEYDAWADAEAGGRLGAETIGHLASCTKWLLESLTEDPDPPPGIPAPRSPRQASRDRGPVMTRREIWRLLTLRCPGCGYRGAFHRADCTRENARTERRAEWRTG